MKKIIILLLLVGISFGVDFGWQNGVPSWVKFGVAPTGTIDMHGDTLVTSKIRGTYIYGTRFTSPSATSYSYYASSAAADTLGFVLTGVSGDRDIVHKDIEEDGTVHYWRWDDGLSLLYAAEFKASTLRGDYIMAELGLNAFNIYSAANMLIDPNYSGIGIATLGNNEGDTLRIQANDILDVNGRADIDTMRVSTMLLQIRHIAATDTLALTDYQIVVDAIANVGLPSAASAFSDGYGQVFGIQLTVAQPCTVYCAGTDFINGADSVALSQWDNLEVVATSDTTWAIR